MKAFKKYLLPILLTVCLAFFGAGLFCVSAKTVKADSTFTLSGASIRYVSAGDDQGIRFVANANKEEFNALAEDNENLSVKMVIASLPNVKNAGINPEELDVNSAIFKHVISVYEKEDGNVTMNIWSEDVLDSNILTANIYIWRIPEEAYQLFWVARIYYTTGSETGYSDNIINKSMSEVALDNYDQATPEQKEKLDEFMKNYTVTWFDDKGAEIKTDYNQKYGETLSVPSAAYKAGYDAVWYKRTGTDVDDNPVWSDTPYDVTAEDSLVRSDTQLKAGYEVKTYTLTYNGLSDAPGGAESASNPATYNVESSTITINNPTHANNYFLGWTFEGQTTPVKNPTIPTGSIGDKTFTANWGDFTKPDDDFVYMGYYGLLTPKSVSGYGVLASDVVYTSSNTSIATVSGHRINAVATGTVTITAKLGNSTYGYRTQTFSVTVKATSEGDGETSARTLDTDLAMHNNNKAALAVANYSGDLTLFVGDSFMDGRNFFTDFYERFATKSAHLLGIGGSRASEWRFLIQDYFAYAPKNIVLHIGTNDLFGGQMSVAATFGYVKNVLEVIRYGAPSAKVYFWSIEDRYTVSGWSKNKNAEITELNDEINAYAIKNSAWLTFVDTRSLLTSASDYKETSGTTIHPSIPTGYDKCIQATFDAGLNLTENVYASTNIVKDWTSVNGTDNFSSAKVMGMQARVSEFVWESDVTIRNFSNGGAKGHITINWRTPTEVGGKTDGQNNRFVILNKSSGIDKGQFHFVGNTPSANAWGTTGADYFYATSGAATTFKLAILVTDTDAYLFYNDILVAVYMNVGLGAATTYTDASYNAFRVGGELATVDFRNNKISNPHLNSSVYEAYLNRDDVARCDADTSVTSQEIVMRATTFNVYNNFYFNPNGISVSFTDKSVTPNKTFTGIVENNKVTVKAESAGEFIGNHIYDVTSEISGLNFKLYSNASVKKLPNTVIAGGSIIEFDIFSAGWNTIKTKTTNGQYNIHLGIGKYSKRLATYNSSDFYSKMSFDLTKLATALPSSFYVAAFIVGNVENNTGGMRFGFNMETSERDYSTTLMQNSGQNNPSIQELNSWAGWGNFSRTTLRNNGYWFVVHYDSANRQKTVYITDSTGNYLEKKDTKTADRYAQSLITLGVAIWDADGSAKTPYTMTLNSFNVGTSLTKALNNTVHISIDTPASCTTSVSTHSLPAGSPLTSGLYSVKADKGSSITSVKINNVTLPDIGSGNYYIIRDAKFIPIVSSLPERINFVDTTLTSSSGYAPYSDVIPTKELTWQAFVGFPSDTTLDIASNGRWWITTQFHTQVMESGVTFFQLLKWDSGLYIKAFDGKGSTYQTAMHNNADIVSTLVRDKGLNIRVVLHGDNMSIYVLAGPGKTLWYQTHDHMPIGNQGSFIEKIDHVKAGDSIVSCNAIITNAAVMTFANDPENVAYLNSTKGSSGVVSERNAITAPSRSETVIGWTGFVGFNVTAGASSPLWTAQNYWLSEVGFFNSDNAGILRVQLAGENGSHKLKLINNGNASTYNLHVYGDEPNGYESYLRNNGGLYIAFAYDKINGKASVWAMNDSTEWHCLIKEVSLDYFGDDIKYVKWRTAQENSSTVLDTAITDSFLKDQKLCFYEIMPFAMANTQYLDIDVEDTITNPASRGISNDLITMEYGYKYHFVQSINIKDYPVSSYAYNYNGQSKGMDSWYVPTSNVRFYNPGMTDDVECQILNWRGFVMMKFRYANDANVANALSFNASNNAGLYKDWTAGLSITIEIVMFLDGADHMWAAAYAYDAHGARYTVSVPVRPYRITNNGNVYWDQGPNALKINQFRMIRNNNVNTYLAGADIMSTDGVAYKTVYEGRPGTIFYADTESEFNSFINNLSSFPVRFTYDGTEYTGFNNQFTKESTTITESDNHDTVNVEIVLRRSSSLKVRIVAALYRSYNAYDYTVYFENDSSSNSGIISNVYSMDYRVQGNTPYLKGILGDHTNKYAPYEYNLAQGSPKFTNVLGRGTHVYFPYFNLETDNGGYMIALGWGGTWDAEFRRLEPGNVTNVLLQSCIGRDATGTSTYLKPGETYRTALVGVVRYFERDEDVATNAWRKWMVDCNLPRENAATDEPVQPSMSSCLAGDSDRPNSDGSASEYYGSWRRSLESMYSHGLNLEFRWFDAGWYISPNGYNDPTAWYGNVGTWQLNTEKWPDGTFRESVDFARENGSKTLVWFEPERISDLSSMVSRHGYNADWAIYAGVSNRYVNNLGNKGCLNWTLNRIITFMSENNIDLYREDFNLDPADYWKVADNNEGSNRRGIAENLYMQGHYALWDGIIEYCAANGKCTYVDSCASGGGRNDLESVRRSVPFLRSDSDRTTIPLKLAYTTTLCKWLPYTGACAKDTNSELSDSDLDTYIMRACFLPHMNISGLWYKKQDTLPWAQIIKGREEWLEANKYFLKDFYVLTPYTGTTNAAVWTAYMYWDNETDSGLLQAFRQASCTSNSITVNVKGVDPNRYYNIRDIDGRQSASRVLGSALRSGFTISAPSARTAVVLYIEPAD